MARFIPARIRYHGVDNATPNDPTPEDEYRRERRSSSLDNSSATQNNPSSKYSGSRVKEKLVGNAGDRQKSRQKGLWRPVALRRTSIAAFFVVFCSMLVALEIMNQYSIRHQGLVRTVQGRHYLWTYGPTASELLHP